MEQIANMEIEKNEDLNEIFSYLPYIDEDDYDFFSPPSENLIYKEENDIPLNLKELYELKNDTELLLSFAMNKINFNYIPYNYQVNYSMQNFAYKSKRLISHPDYNFALCEYLYKYGNILKKYNGDSLLSEFPCNIKVDMDGIILNGIFKDEKFIDRESIIKQGAFGASPSNKEPLIIRNKIEEILQLVIESINIKKLNIAHNRLTLTKLIHPRLGKNAYLYLPYDLIEKISKNTNQYGKGRIKTKKKY